MLTSQKQLEAAQKFLRGISKLPTFACVREKQFDAVRKAIEKASGMSTAQAAAWLSAIDETVWDDSQVQGFQTAIAAKTAAAQEESTRPSQQDFMMLPYYLTEELASDILLATVSKEQLLLRLCAHAAKLSLRSATEGTKGVIVALAYWTLFRDGVSYSKQFQIYQQNKPIVTKVLQLSPPEVLLSALPMDYRQLPGQLLQSTFPSGAPADMKDLASQILQFARNMPLRKDHRLLQGVPAEQETASGTLGGGAVSVEAVCKVVEACSRGMQLARGTSAQSVTTTVSATGSDVPRLLALEDGKVEGDAEAKEANASAPSAPAKTVQAAAPIALSVEAQLEALKPQVGAPGKSPKGTMIAKRPAAKEGADTGHVKCFKRPSCKVAKMPAAKRFRSTTTKRAKEIVKSSKPRAASVKVKTCMKAKKHSGTKSARDLRREALLRTVPCALKRQYAQGCSKCRGRALCTLSCWAERGFVVP